MCTLMQPGRIALGALLSVLCGPANSASIFTPDPARGLLFAQGARVPDDYRIFRSEDLPTRAKAFVSELATRWSGTSADALSGLKAKYGAEVDYFGKRISRDRVLADKRRFVERWPERSYKIKSSYEQCNAFECVVDGYMEWETRNPARKAMASGEATFRYVLKLSGHAFVIRAEGGNIIQRRPQIYQPESAVANGSSNDSMDGQDAARDQQIHPKAEIESLAAIAIEHDVKQVVAESHQSTQPSQPEFTIARETYPGRNARSDVFDARFVTLAGIILSFILLRVVRWELRTRKSQINAEARTKRQTKQRGESNKPNNGKRSHTFPYGCTRARWDQQGPTGPRVTRKAQWRGAEKQEGDVHIQWWQELKEAAKGREAEPQREREQATNRRSNGNAWWTILEVSPAAGKDEIVRSYRHKIQRCHPDRVSGLAPEFVLLAEERTKALNEAYAQAMRPRR
jgi:hypothetical protein